jgi:hypothetical protein
MKDPSSLSDDQLERARDLGGATFLSAYVTMMARKLEVPVDNDAARAMAMQMIMPLNLAAEAAWRALMDDREGADDAIGRLRLVLDTLG